MPPEMGRAIDRALRAHGLREQARHAAGFTVEVLDDVLQGAPGPARRLGRLADALNKAARKLEVLDRAPSSIRALDDYADRLRALVPEEVVANDD